MYIVVEFILPYILLISIYGDSAGRKLILMGRRCNLHYSWKEPCRENPDLGVIYPERVSSVWVAFFHVSKEDGKLPFLKKASLVLAVSSTSCSQPSFSSAREEQTHVFDIFSSVSLGSPETACKLVYWASGMQTGKWRHQLCDFLYLCSCQRECWNLQRYKSGVFHHHCQQGISKLRYEPFGGMVNEQKCMLALALFSVVRWMN